MDRLYSRFAPCWFLCFFALYASICEAKERWLFIGDSITYCGHFTDYVETWFLLNEEDAPEIINLGLGSETVSGLSEEDHPFFRPYVHTRLGQVLEKVKPDVVFAGYGMNCGIYHPFSDERFEAYKNGIDALVETVQASGASVILLTPPPYASRIHKRKQPVEGESYSWKAPAADYNEVLATYAEWILSYDEKNGIRAINTRPGLERFMDESYPREPIHPNGFGHELIAESILAGLGKDTGFDLLDTGVSSRMDDSLWVELQAIVRKQREAYDRSLLNNIGHGNIPVMAADVLPLEEAKENSAEFDLEILKLLQSL